MNAESGETEAFSAVLQSNCRIFLIIYLTCILRSLLTARICHQLLESPIFSSLYTEILKSKMNTIVKTPSAPNLLR